MSPPWPFTIAHAVKGQAPWKTYVFRTNRTPTVMTALHRAAQMRRAGYLVWIEATGKPATR